MNGGRSPRSRRPRSTTYGFVKLDGEETIRIILVFKATPGGMVGARCVTAKGREDPSAASWVVEQLRRLGVGKRMLQADGEPATRAMVKDVIGEVCASSALGVAGAHSPAHDHRANGMVERAVRELKDQAGVTHCTLNDKAGKVSSPQRQGCLRLDGDLGSGGARRSADRDRRHGELPSTARTGVEPSDCAVRRVGAREASACSGPGRSGAQVGLGHVLRSPLGHRRALRLGRRRLCLPGAGRSPCA